MVLESFLIRKGICSEWWLQELLSVRGSLPIQTCLMQYAWVGVSFQMHRLKILQTCDIYLLSYLSVTFLLTLHRRCCFHFRGLHVCSEVLPFDRLTVREIT